MGWDYVSELRPPTDLLFFPQVIYEYGALAELYWHDKPNNSEKNLSQCHFVHHKSHMDWPGANSGLRGERPATNRLSQGTAHSVGLLELLWKKLYSGI
jgi:hypothetical protein